MIVELVDIQIHAGRQAAFEAAVQQGVETVIAKATGHRGWRLHHGIESPTRYVLLLCWDTLENHTVDFRGSTAFTEWRAIVGPFFAEPPKVEHFDIVGGSKPTPD